MKLPFLPLMAATLGGLLVTCGDTRAQFHPEIGAEITPIRAERAPLVRETLFARDGRPATVIAYPSRQPEARALAVEIQAAFQERFSLPARIESSADLVEEDYRDHTVIHLGNIYSNPALLWFYLHSFTYADASWPGADGWAIQQVSDPKGFGTNVLIIAASTEAGLAAGVARFVEEIARLEQPAWSEFILVESDTPPVTGNPPRLSEEQIAELEGRYLEAMRNNALRTTAEQAIWEARFYLMSGNENYLAPLRACVPAHLQYLREAGNQQAETIYFWFFKYAQLWDAVEHSDYWDDEFRETMVNLLYWLSEVVVNIGHFEQSLNPYPKNNHETYAAVSLLFPALYFQKYYDLERAGYWRSLAEQVLATQAGFPRGMDESRFYYEHAGMHALFHAIATGDRAFVDSGNARQFADLLMLLTDNLGDAPGFGDSRRYGHNRTYYYLLPFANLAGDPSYLGLNNLVRDYVENPQLIWELGPGGHSHSLHHYIPPAAPELPPSPPGVRVVRLHKSLYEREQHDPVFTHIPEPEIWPPHPDTFDKLVFRNGYDRNKEYLLLDGYGRGIHSHRDANVITRFTDRGRVWLVDDTYFRNSAAYHNALMVIRDGEGGFSPPFAALETAATLGRAGFSRTTAPGFNGIDWTRNIFWIREDVFVVLDEALARYPGDYQLQTFWRSLGVMTERPARVQFDQQGESFAISFPGDLGLRSAPDLGNTQDQSTWATYPFADPVVQRTMAYRSADLEPGELRSFPAVLATFPTERPRVIDCRRLNDTTLLTREAAETRLFFSDPGNLPDFLETDARMGLVTPSLLALADASQLVLQGVRFLNEPEPVACEIDFAAQEITVFTRDEALVTDLALPAKAHAANARRIPWPRNGSAAETLADTLHHLWATAAHVQPPPPAAPDAPLLEPVTRQEFGELTVHDALILPPASGSAPAFLLATEEGLLARAFDDHGPLWLRETDSPVHALTTARFEGEPAIVFGTARGEVVAVNPDGTERWTYRIPRRRGSLYGAGARVFSISAGDTNGNGSDEILVTTSHWMSHLIDGGGRLIWGEPVARNSLISSAFGDLNGDGRRELLIGSENFRMHAFTRDYQILWSFRSKRGTIDRIHPVDLTGDGAEEVLVGSSDGHLYAVKTRIEELVPTDYHPRDPALTPIDVLFEYDTGSDVLAIATGFLDSSDRPRIIAGSDSFFLYRFGPDGTREAMTNAGDRVRQIRILADTPAEHRIAAGLADGRILLLTADLEPTAAARIGSEILALDHDRETGQLLAVGRASAGSFSLAKDKLSPGENPGAH